MAKYRSDIVQGIIDQLDSTALDVIIQEFLETPENGFLDSTTILVYVNDGTAWNYIDATTIVVINTGYDEEQTDWVYPPNKTVEEWKAIYLEDYYNQAYEAQGKTRITDSDSPTYPLKSFYNLLDLEPSLLINYDITPDATTETFIQYQYAVSKPMSAIALQLGEDGYLNYGGAEDGLFLAFYIAFSTNGTNWKYICAQDATTNIAVDNVESDIVFDQDYARQHPLFITSIISSAPVSDVKQVALETLSVEAKYWRLYIVDLYDILDQNGYSAGYTGYTASLSFLGFDQNKVSTKAVYEFAATGGMITDRNLADDAVITRTIKNGNVTQEKLAELAINTVNIIDGAVTAHKISPSVATIYGNPGSGGSGTNISAGNTITYVTFSLPNDDGISGLTSYWAIDSYAAAAMVVDLQYRNASGTYVSCDSWSVLSTSGGLAHNLIHGETERADGSTTRNFRLRVTNTSGATKAFYLNYIKMFGIFVGNIDA